MKFQYSTEEFPAIPTLDLRLGAPYGALSIGPLRAYVDTGADATVVPISYLGPLRESISDTKNMRSSWGERREVPIYLLDVGIGDLRFPFIEIVADELGEEIIVGRNVLNKLVLTLDGPQGVLEIVR